MTELKKAIKRYEKVCEKLELLNEEAFGLEQEISRLNTAKQNKDKLMADILVDFGLKEVK